MTTASDDHGRTEQADAPGPRGLPLADPTVGAPPRERADAARNRARILDAAERLFAEHGVGHVGVADVARVAGVGVGTIYRRFGDRSGLALALLEDREIQLQDAVMRGPAPLGPEAPPDVRLRAFIGAVVELLEAHTDLLVASESGADARFNTGLYGFYRLHVALLLEQGVAARGLEAGEAPGTVDVDYLAHALLAPLDAELYRHLRNSGMSTRRIGAGMEALVDSVFGCAGNPPAGA